jgi:insertion element IS1 protein InsB
MDEQWGYVGAKSRQRWLFYAYDRLGRRLWRTYSVNTMAWTKRLSLLSSLEVVVWMTDGCRCMNPPEGKTARYQQTLLSALSDIT